MVGSGKRDGGTMTHHLQTLHREERVLVRARAAENGLAVLDGDLARVREEHPDGVERHCEEVAEEQERRLLDAVQRRVNMSDILGDCGTETYAASRHTGSRTQLPPSSKYLKHHTRRTSGDSSAKAR